MIKWHATNEKNTHYYRLQHKPITFVTTYKIQRAPNIHLPAVT